MSPLIILFIISLTIPLPIASNSNQPQPDTIPALPVARASNQTSSPCELDLSDELFGGVGDACVRGGLDRSRCCPVLAAWLFAAHARSALQLRGTDGGPGEYLDGSDGPMMPDDSQKCVDSLLGALEGRGIVLPRPNSTCDTVLCFCGIRLHQIGSLSCPAAFNSSGGGDGGRGEKDDRSSHVGVGVVVRNATPTAAVRQLERDCRNASYAGCTRCLQSLGKVRGHFEVGGGSGYDDRANKMFARDCQLMGLTWLLATNKTAYIPTVSAVLRALLYSARPAGHVAVGGRSRCSPDQENMPLAVDALQLQHDEGLAVVLFSSRFALVICSIAAAVLPLLLV